MTTDFMPPRIRTALVGVGPHARENILPALRLNPICELVTVCSRNADNAKAVALEWGIESCSNDWQSMLDPQAIDAVIVCATPQVHSAVGQSALSRGIPAYLEKPPAVDIACLHSLLDAASRSEAAIMVGYNLLHTAPYRALRDAIVAEGGAQHIKIKCQASKPKMSLWGQDLLSSMLYAVGIHAISMAEDLGPGLEVDHFHSSEWLNDGLAATIILSNIEGVSCVIQIGNYSNRFIFDVEIATRNGSVICLNELSTLTISGGDTSDARRLGTKGVETCHAGVLRNPFYFSGYGYAIGSFLEEISGAAEKNGSLDLSRRTFLIIEKCLGARPWGRHDAS